MFENFKTKVYLLLDNPKRRQKSHIDFREALEQMYEQGYYSAEKIWKEKMEQREHDIKEDYRILLAMKDVELKQMANEIEDQKKNLKDAVKAYQSYYHETITNKKLIAQVSSQIRNLFNSSGEIFKSFLHIQDAATNHFQTMLKQDPLNRNLLGMTMGPEDLDNQHKKSTEHKLLEEEIQQIQKDIEQFDIKKLKEN